MRRPLLLHSENAAYSSSIGRFVAAHSSHPFIDLPSRLEVRLGEPIREFVVRRGQAELRAAERELLTELLAELGVQPVVLALGAGTLLERSFRLELLERCILVNLETPHESSDPTQPRELLEYGKLASAETHARISLEGRAVEEVAQEVIDTWRRDPIAVAAGAHSYSVEIGSGIRFSRPSALLVDPSLIVLVSDETVFSLHGERVREKLPRPDELVTTIQLPPGEENKHIGSVEPIWRAALEAGADRRSWFVALGGGVVSDITGFAAATYMRGVPWIGIPSTLLAMVDASVGGKTGVDLLAAKNAVGAFWQPRGVLCDVDLLQTEGARAFRSALAEVVKTAIIGDPELLDLLENQAERISHRDLELLIELVRRSIRVKARIVGRDERESGLRAVLNLGHTVGHALEAAAGYSRLTHGEAVSLGLVAALRIGRALSITPDRLCQRVERLLETLGLPTDLSSEPIERAAQLIGHDKKRQGQKLNFVVASEAGKVSCLPLELDRIRELSRSVVNTAFR